ncbi:hypothetical protein NAAC61_08350 [Petrotoga sp. 8T1HF07.NaAc.6.1]|uniref:macro domain-containing protein n=1 Tax=Petrotoga sp. 8T1HF07.NaAc.6.1 TaxID=1351838 RepID=UPI00192AAF95|nr:macro domain-containing protein [Petrotoga sp. 8T1HF07.NaAc.6.1]MBL5982024.1 hypothetical protein [Petrotoga sp. 8T1HF07.NaAc.6.1]
MQIVKYSLLEFLEPGNLIINPVNTEGYMGKGLALEIAIRFPETEKKYKETCKKGELKPGEIFFYKENDIIIGNMATKSRFKYPSKIEWIQLGVENLKRYLIQNAIQNKVIIPKIGSGLGKLSWNEVEVLIEKTLKDLDNVIIALDEEKGPKETKAIQEYYTHEISSNLFDIKTNEKVERFRELLKQKGIGKNKYALYVRKYF